jgi:hypothetical protein
MTARSRARWRIKFYHAFALGGGAVFGKKQRKRIRELAHLLSQNDGLPARKEQESGWIVRIWRGLGTQKDRFCTMAQQAHGERSAIATTPPGWSNATGSLRRTPSGRSNFSSPPRQHSVQADVPETAGSKLARLAVGVSARSARASRSLSLDAAFAALSRYIQPRRRSTAVSKAI